MSRLVVTNTTPLIALALIRKLHLLSDLYGEVLAPPAVYAEVIAGEAERTDVAEIRTASYVRVQPLSDPRRADVLTSLDRGEAEAIALAQEINADLLIMDEHLGRRAARRLRLAVTGTIGILLKSKTLGYVETVQPLITELQQRGIYLSDTLVRHALELAGEERHRGVSQLPSSHPYSMPCCLNNACNRASASISSVIRLTAAFNISHMTSWFAARLAGTSNRIGNVWRV